jgi:serine/threonine-protein kinase
MELAEGGSLAQRINGTPQPQRQAAQWLEALARAVHHAHQQGIVHRDLKPANVVLTADGVPQVTDFGLSKRLDGETAHTRGGGPIGTLGYIAPEQAAGKMAEIGPHSDVYALGAILYELLTGSVPVQGDSYDERLHQVLTQEPRLPRRLNPAVDRELEAACLKCLEKKPQRRYPSAEALADDLSRWLRGEPTRARPLRWTGRARRVLRRHASKVLLGLAAAIAPVLLIVNYLREPSRPREDGPPRPDPARKQAPGGQQAGPDKTLKDRKPDPPLWSRLPTGLADSKLAQKPDDPFRIQSSKLALVELQAKPPGEHYRISAEVRLDKADRVQGQAGIYFMYDEYNPLERLRVHRFCALTFNDLVPIRPNFSKLGMPATRVYFTIQRAVETTPSPAHDIAKCRHGDFQPKPKAWRKIAVEVTPETIRFFCEDTLFGELARDQFTKSLRLTGLNKPTDTGDVRPHYPTRGALGLHVVQAAASFRRVVIEPLPGNNP